MTGRSSGPGGPGSGIGRRGGGRQGGPGKRGGFAAGPGGNCVCPNCGHKTPHERGTPCFQIDCPKCGAAMTRER